MHVANPKMAATLEQLTAAVESSLPQAAGSAGTGGGGGPGTSVEDLGAAYRHFFDPQEAGAEAAAEDAAGATAAPAGGGGGGGGGDDSGEADDGFHGTDLLSAYYAQYGHPTHAAAGHGGDEAAVAAAETGEDRTEEDVSGGEAVAVAAAAAHDYPLHPPAQAGGAFPQAASDYDSDDGIAAPADGLPPAAAGDAADPAAVAVGAPPAKVEDWLLDVGEGYKEHLTRLRAERVRQELMLIQDKPTITTHAKGLTRGGRPVEERLLQEHEDRQSKWRRQVGREAGDPECTHQPSINDYSHSRRPRYGDDPNGVGKEQRLERLRSQQRDEEERAVTARPAIDDHSRRIAAKRTQGLPVEEHLILTDRQHKQEMFERHEAASTKGLHAQPTITRRAASLKRDGDVSERLYSMRLGGSLSSVLQNFTSSTPLDLSQQRAHKGLASALHARGEAETFRPKINARSSASPARSPHSDERVEERLYRQYVELQKAKEEREKEAAAASQAASSVRHTSKNSELIYSLRELDKDTQTRLYSKHNSRRGTAQAPSTPSKTITDAAFRARLEDWEDMKQHRATETRRKKEELEKARMKECTFDPAKSPAIRRMRRSSVCRASTSQAVPDGSLVDRNSSWAARREAKLSRQTKQKEMTEQEGCSFVPYINKVVPKNNVDPANAYGYTEFIDRLRKARDDNQLEEQRKETIFASGHRWNGEATVPKEPKLGQGRSSSKKRRIKSLQKVAQPFDWNAGRHEGGRAASAQRGRSAGGRSEARSGSYGGNRRISPSRIPQPAAGDSDDQQDDFGVGSPMAIYRQPAGGDVVPRPFTFPPSWTTGHDSGFIDENAAVNDFLTSQHANVMAMVDR